MNDFPILGETAFVKTRRQFHSIAKILGKIRETLVKPIAKSDNLWLGISSGGFSIPPIEQNNDLEIGCNPARLVVEISNNKGLHETAPLNGYSLKEIARWLAESDALSALSGTGVTEELAKFDSGIVFEISEQNASDFHTQLVNYNVLLREFHSGINTGVKAGICLWPHHFDNAFKWFSGRKIDDQDEQMGIGVSNGDEYYELPYIYVTFGPALRKTNTLEIAEGGILHDGDWTGLVLPYEAVAERGSIDLQRKLIEEFFNVTFAAVTRAFTKR
jgi:hypothetical protein